MKARVFIGSSSEQVDTAYAIQRNLERTCDATVWDQGVFALTSNILDDLVAVLDRTDFGIFVFGLDDLTTIRAKEYQSTRDNVVFELGLFIGKLGKARTFFVMPKERGDFRLPSELKNPVRPSTEFACSRTRVLAGSVRSKVPCLI